MMIFLVRRKERRVLSRQSPVVGINLLVKQFCSLHYLESAPIYSAYDYFIYFYYFLTDESFNGNKTKQKTTENTATVAPLISSNPDRSEFVLHLGRWPEHTTTVQSLWWGCSVNCFWGFRFSCCIFLASDGNTASIKTLESILLVLKEITKCPPFCRKV